MFCFSETLQLLTLNQLKGLTVTRHSSCGLQLWYRCCTCIISKLDGHVFSLTLFPQTICNCHSQNTLWFLLPCWAAMCYWLHVRNHLAHLLCKTTQSHIPEYIVCLLFLNAGSISIFVLIWLWKYDTVMKADIHFKICVWTLSLLSETQFSSCDWICLLRESWMTCYLCSVRPISLPFATQRSPYVLIDTVHCVCNHVSCKTLPQPWKRAFRIQMWQMASLRFCQYSLWTCWV